MRRWVQTFTTADVVIWSVTFMLAVVLAFGLSLSVWSHLPGFASIALMRIAQVVLGLAVLLIGLALPARVAQIFTIGFALGLVGSAGFAAQAFASASLGG
ncbi:MAG TPA: hypothetical protein VIG51_12600 [Candidatus Baltobacteraceae bacterium]|jgi:hypothetical protein